MTDIMNELDSENTDVKKPQKELPVVQDQGFFHHNTGDTYDGFFEAKKKDKSVKMHGPGVYTTAEGDVYTGSWEGDRFGANDEVTISYIDGSKYEGSFKDWSYIGQGKYFYPDGSLLQCDFVDSCPSGNLVLIDPNGHTWSGKADQGYGWLDPANHYYEMLARTRDMSRTKRHTVSIKGLFDANLSRISRIKSNVK